LLVLFIYESSIIKFNQSGTIIWENNYQNSTYPLPFIRDFCIDSDNNILATGYGSGIAVFDYMTKKISSAGNDIWFQQFNGYENLRDYASSICVDDSNRVFVTGSTNDMINNGTSYTLRYSPTGIQDWILMFDAPHSRFESPVKILLDDSNNVFVGGHVADSTNGWNFFLLKIEQKIGSSIFSSKHNFPNGYCLEQNFPNPFNPITKIKFEVKHSEKVIIEVFDVLGNKVKELINQYLKAGEYIVDFNGEELPSGIYYYRLKSKYFNECKKSILIK